MLWKWKINNCHCECKNTKEQNIYKNIYILNLAICTWEHDQYSGSLVGDSMDTSDKIINAADNVSPNVPKNVVSSVSTNVMSTAPINFHDNKVHYYFCTCFY